MELSIRKIYIDSRFLSKGTPSAFESELPEIVNLPKETAAVITELTCVASWDTISDSNNKLYIVEESSTGALSARILTLNSAPYDSETLRVEVENKLNSNKPANIGTYTVTRVTSASVQSSSGASYRYYQVAVSGGSKFYVPVDSTLKDSTWRGAMWYNSFNGPDYDLASLRSTNELFNFEGQQTFQPSHTSSFVDLRSKHSLFVHSPSFGNYSAISPSGSRTVIAKIPVDSAYGSVIHYQHSGSTYDFIEVTNGALKNLYFELRDARGELVDLKGGHWSMTICLTPLPM